MRSDEEEGRPGSRGMTCGHPYAMYIFSFSFYKERERRSKEEKRVEIWEWDREREESQVGVVFWSTALITRLSLVRSFHDREKEESQVDLFALMKKN
jgi:hypothetical protein